MAGRRADCRREFVRPALLRKRGHISGSAVLGTVAVERIVDGLMVSLLFAGCAIAVAEIISYVFQLKGREMPA